MNAYRITLSYRPPRCRANRWIKGIVLADTEHEALELFKNRIGEERYNRGKNQSCFNLRIELMNEVFIYKQEF